ncbi:MAG: TIGR03617 family F420-dependent LLM class oxidoreductase [Anaerolineae bacterium]|nr:TIGR03617 family F420-dependent LLM class oxidoreductase [Anaerolineae bacterium]NUQ03592.1 TIGR03617 family F420-dependent LLM class oxidoreductase [Anaerolineae bacterium]
MKFDVTIFPDNLNTAGELARTVESYGFHGLWTSETAHNPFLPLTHAAGATHRIDLGTAIAVAFPRSPMVTAQIAWDLAEQSTGRFILGLGTQVKPHIEKRFSTSWGAPAPRLREYIESMRAIWRSFQTGAPLRYLGEYYKFTLLTPFFAPTAMPYSEIPIYIAGVNEHLCRLAGEMCQGFHVHPFHTTRYLRELIIPNVLIGAEKANRHRGDCALTCAIFIVTGKNQQEIRDNAGMVRSQIAFYASTPSYRAVMDMHGWGELHERLNQLSREGRWFEMGELINDDILHEIAVIAPIDELGQAVKARYEGLLDRVGYYIPFKPEEIENKPIWDNAAKVFCQ